MVKKTIKVIRGKAVIHSDYTDGGLVHNVTFTPENQTQSRIESRAMIEYIKNAKTFIFKDLKW